jgi:hypothetical protein
VVPLQASSYNKGQVGKATLLPQGSATRIVLWFSSVPNHLTLPVHVYTYVYEGGCSALPASAAMTLNDRVLVTSPSGIEGPKLVHTAPVPIDQLLTGRFSLALRSAPADGDQVLYCGELRKDA